NDAWLPLQCNWDWTFRDLIAHTQQQLLLIQRHAEIPYRVLVAELGEQGVLMPRPPVRVHMTTVVPPISFANLRLTWRNMNWYPMQRRLIFNFNELDEHDGCFFNFDARVYSTILVRDLLACLIDFIRTAAAKPDERLCTLIEADSIGDRLRQQQLPISA